MTNVVDAGLQALKIVLMVLIAVALGFAVFFCVTKVGSLNSRAANLQACLTTKDNSPNGTTVSSCPVASVNAGEISSLHSEADTLGSLGWIIFFVEFFVVGGTVLEILTD